MSLKKKNEFVFTWRIKNYSYCLQTKGESIDSPSFNVENICGGSKWHLLLYPKGQAELPDDRKFVSCSLVWEPTDGVTEIPAINFCFEITDESGNILVRERSLGDRVFTKIYTTWLFTEFISIDELTKAMDSWKEDVLTVRCIIEGNRGENLKICETEACTTIDVGRRFLEWNVKMPVLLEYTESMDFSIPNLYDFKITLFENFALFFHLQKHYNSLTRPVRFKIDIYAKSGYKIISKCVEHLFQPKQTWEFPDIITRDVLEVCKVDSINCEFKMKCEISASKRTASANYIEKLKFRTSACVDAISEVRLVSSMPIDFRNLYNDKKYCDVTIRAKDEEFRVHKVVLRIRSPVFADIVQQKLLESENGVVDLGDEINECSMDCFVEFLYKGETCLDREWITGVMSVADKYQVPALMDQCISYLKSDLSIKSACDIIYIADSIKCESVKSCALSFIKDNAAKILALPAWVDLTKENIKLATEILSELSINLLAKYVTRPPCQKLSMIKERQNGRYKKKRSMN